MYLVQVSIVFHLHRIFFLKGLYYLPEYAKGFNPVNWNLQLGAIFGEFKDVNFVWVSPMHTSLDGVREKFKNVDFLTYEEIYKNIR